MASEGGKPNCARPAPMVTHLTANLALILPVVGAGSSKVAGSSGKPRGAAVHRALRPIARRMRHTAEVAAAAADRGLAEGASCIVHAT